LTHRTSRDDLLVSRPPRPNGVVITGQPEISSVWPEVFDAVVGQLRRRGVDLHTAEDAAQEAGSRAFAGRIPFTDGRDLQRWAHKVAWRVVLDQKRLDARWDRSSTLDPISAQEVSTEVEGRLELAATSRAWSRLSAEDRTAIATASAPPPSDRRAAVRLAVRRHRARNRLLALIDGAAAFAFFLFRRGRRVMAGVGAVVVLVPALFAALPFGEEAKQTRSTEPTEMRAVSDLLVDRAAQNAPREVTVEPTQGRTRAPSTAPSRVGDQRTYAPSVRVPVPTPEQLDRPAKAWTRPKSPDEPLVCVWTGAVGKFCTPGAALELPSAPKP
jgi:DNA-directed RNA polymerase specialized sigma24 family protein